MFVKSIEFENVRGFKRLRFEFERPEGGYAGWTVFVGGNSSGKSTLLKGIALALLGPETGRQLMGNPSGWIHTEEKRAHAVAGISWDREQDAFKKGGAPPGLAFEAGVRWVQDVKAGEIPLFRPVEKRNPNGTRIQTAERGPWNPNAEGWFSCGYGPMRRLSGFSSESVRYSVEKGAISRYVTLFREDAALSESEEWLKKTHSRMLETKSRDLGNLLEGVKALLADELLPLGMRVSRITVDHVFLRDRQGLELPMRDISDGCRSIYATVLDLVHGMSEVYGVEGLFGKSSDSHPIVTKPGVVIIDEIEAHLHPSWQREIPVWLKTHFPRIQFLVSTHSPLIAQAADENGVFVLPQKDEEEREARKLSAEEYKRLRWGRAEKVLLGAAFGLTSTRSRWANQQIERWQRLNAKQKAGGQLSNREATDYRELKKQLELALEPVRELEAP